MDKRRKVKSKDEENIENTTNKYTENAEKRRRHG